MVDGNIELTFKFGIAFFTTLLALSLKLIDRTFLVVQRTFNRPPLVGAEEFEQALRLILNNRKLENKKILLIFDNIDRASFEKTEEILTGISAFFDHEENKNLVILVPFAIGRKCGLSQETVQKFFDSVIPIPELVPEDLTDYTIELFKQVQWTKNVEDLSALINFGPYITPREIKHFINKFIASYNLATRMETEAGDNYHEPYLSKGTISDHPLTLAKIMICDDLEVGLLHEVVRSHLSIDDFFSWEKIKERIEKIKENNDLEGFLNATIGLPGDFPVSADPFLYFKGADALLNIPGAHEISKSLTEGKSDSIKSYADSTKEENIHNLETILQITLKKYKGNDQRIKNATIVILSSFDRVLPDGIRGEIANVLRDKPHFLKDIKLKSLEKISPSKGDDTIENSDIWIEIDKIFKERSKDNENIEKFYDWLIKYLEVVINQQGATKRVGLNSTFFRSDFFFEEKIINAMGNSYPLDLVSSDHCIDVLTEIKDNKFLRSKDFDIKHLIKFIETGIGNADINIKANITQYFQGIWALISGKINTPQFDQKTFKSIFSSLMAIPLDDKVDATAWAPLTDSLNGNHTIFNSKFNTGFQSEIISLILAINKKIKINTLANLKNTFTSTYVAQITPGIIRAVSDFHGGMEWAVDIKEICLPQFLKTIKTEEAVTFLLNEASSKMADLFLENFNNFKDSPALLKEFEKLKENSDSTISKADIVEKVLETPSKMVTELRDKALKLKSVLNLNEDKFANLFNFEIQNATELKRTNKLINIVKNEFSGNILDQMEQSSKNMLDKFPGNEFTVKEMCQFYYSTSNFESSTNTYLKSVIDISIQKGIMDCSNSEVTHAVYERIMTIFTKNKAIDESTFESLDKSIRNSKGIDDDKKKEYKDNLKKIKKIHFKGMLGEILK